MKFIYVPIRIPWSCEYYSIHHCRVQIVNLGVDFRVNWQTNKWFIGKTIHRMPNLYHPIPMLPIGNNICILEYLISAPGALAEGSSTEIRLEQSLNNPLPTSGFSNACQRLRKLNMLPFLAAPEGVSIRILSHYVFGTCSTCFSALSHQRQKRIALRNLSRHGRIYPHVSNHSAFLLMCFHSSQRSTSTSNPLLVVASLFLHDGV
eukprot:scaffold4314_cov116-Cylindrotheca_fusiformis.AAC.2